MELVYTSNYVNYGKKRRSANRTSRLMLAVLALISLIVVVIMFFRYTSSVMTKNKAENEYNTLNEQSSALYTQKQEKQTELDNLQAAFEKTEAEYASYEDN